MLYTALYMSATRTQIYLTSEQRKRLDALSVRTGRTLADLIREAVDGYLAGGPSDPAESLAATFGALPAIAVPSRDEWDRG